MNQNRKLVITGGNGFIGLNVAKRLHDQGEYVRIVDSSDDQTFRRYKNIHDACSEFIKGDLRDVDFCRKALTDARQVFHFAANMGGMGVIHSANNFRIYQDNHLMTLNVLEAAMAEKVEQFFFASSACVYPNSKQSDHTDEDFQLKESDAWASVPQPQEFYGTEKLCGELLVRQFGATYNISVRIARFHNVYGEGSAWFGGREKAPAALLRKAICAGIYEKDHVIEVWGSGKQRRSFLHIDDCVDAILLLTKSDYSQPLNIGSDEAVSMAELAYIAFETIEISRNFVNIVPDSSKPIGVQNRNSDNTLIKKMLGWSPKVNIREGMQRTSKWIQVELTNQLLNANGIQRSHLLDKYKHSVVKNLAKDEITFGVLLPITSRGLSKPEDCISNLQKFVESLRDTTKTDRSNCFDKRYKLKVYIGIDKNDAFFHPIEDNCAKRTLMEYGIPDVETMVFDYPPGSICAIWRGLARRAYDRGCQYTVLFGDDVVLKTIGWMSRIDDAFHALAIEKHVPYGFGCVAFSDLSFPGFPTFPVVSRVHLDIFKGDVIPPGFVNQDGDPYLFQLYRRWGCSVMLPDVKLTNTVGGEIATRYEKKHHQNWTFEILDDGVNSVQTWLEKNSPTAPPRLLTLDVIIPSYRVQMKYLEPIIRLNRSPTASTMIIIIVDNPESPNINVLKDCYEQDPFVRIRVHNSNMGASQARNRGLGESAADYILFLDDDVTPDPDILLECEKVIRQYPNACGFIGCTKFPDPTPSIASSAITMWGGTFFWDICEHIEEDIPWGVTANLLARRYKDNVWFDEQFPKTGGGEDIDYCLKKKRFFVDNVLGGEGFRAAPQVKAIHPWWNNGGRVYRRFMKWAAGDGALINMYPELTYRDAAPNTAESLLGVAILALMTLLSMTVGITAIHRRLLIIFLITIPLIPVANIIFDVHHHMFVEPTACVPALRGYRRILAAAESSVIRIANDWGRLEGHIRRKEWSCIGQRFDWFAGRRGGVPIAHERSNSVFRFLILVGLVTSVASWVFA